MKDRKETDARAHICQDSAQASQGRAANADQAHDSTKRSNGSTLSPEAAFSAGYRAGCAEGYKVAAADVLRCPEEAKMLMDREEARRRKLRLGPDDPMVSRVETALLEYVGVLDGETR